MTRKEFLEKSLIMGIGLPFLPAALTPPYRSPRLVFPGLPTGFTGKVIIVGAGAAGMAAGYLLNRHKIDFEILEAAAVYGGRIKKAAAFTDFPVDLGAEWIHVHPRVLSEITNRPNAAAGVETMEYNPQTIMTWKKGKLRPRNYIRYLYSEWKFKRGSWFDFFEQNIVPEISGRITLSRPVTEINYEGEKVLVKTADQETRRADKVLITVPVRMLQKEQIRFTPALPEPKREAIGKVLMGDGIKIFVEFREKFYPDILAFGNVFKSLTEENKFVYDAAFNKGSGRHVLGLFAINEKASAYTRLGTEEQMIQAFLAELDTLFGGKASANYVNHIIQNWSAEPYIQGAYSYSFDGRQKDIVQAIAEPVMGKLYFAGEALSLDNQAMVQGACQSAYATVERMLGARVQAGRE